VIVARRGGEGGDGATTVGNSREPARPAAEGEAEVEAELRERFGDDHPLLTPGLFRGTLWYQAAAWEFLDLGDYRFA